MKMVDTLREKESGNLKNKKSAKGITLIALIITIIVLLILSVVTLNAVIGNDGIIAKAQLAREKTNQSQGEEENKIKDLENELVNYSTRTNNTESTTSGETLLWDTPITSGTITFLNNHTIDEFNEIRLVYVTHDNSIIMEDTISTATIKKSIDNNQIVEFMHSHITYLMFTFTPNSMKIETNKDNTNPFTITQVYGIK